MVTTTERPQKPNSFQLIKQEDDKFFSKLLSKEHNERSFRVGYDDARSGAVPFFWESQPGTPKHRFFDVDTVPPLTPPPSYHLNKASSGNAKQSPSSLGKKLLASKSNLLRILFLKGRGKKSSDLPPPKELCQPDIAKDDDHAPEFTPPRDTTTSDSSIASSEGNNNSNLHWQRRFLSNESSSSSDSSVNDGDQYCIDGPPNPAPWLRATRTRQRGLRNLMLSTPN